MNKHYWHKCKTLDILMVCITALQILSQDKLAVSDMLAFIYDEQPSEEDFIKEMARMCEANSWDTIG